MAVISLVNYQVKPGRMGDFIAGAREAKEVIEGLAVNLQSTRVFRTAVAGPSTGIVRVIFEYGEVTDWAETIVREANDARFNELLARNMGPDAPDELIGRGLHADVVPPAGTGTGSVLQVGVGRVKPGRWDDYLGYIENHNEMVLDSGAERVRNMQIIVAGPNTGMVTVLSEYRDMPAFGEAWQRRNGDPAWRELIDSIIGPDGPVSFDGQMILTEIEI